MPDDETPPPPEVLVPDDPPLPLAKAVRRRAKPAARPAKPSLWLWLLLGGAFLGLICTGVVAAVVVSTVEREQEIAAAQEDARRNADLAAWEIANRDRLKGQVKRFPNDAPAPEVARIPARPEKVPAPAAVVPAVPPAPPVFQPVPKELPPPPPGPKPPANPGDPAKLRGLAFLATFETPELVDVFSNTPATRGQVFMAGPPQGIAAESGVRGKCYRPQPGTQAPFFAAEKWHRGPGQAFTAAVWYAASPTSFGTNPVMNFGNAVGVKLEANGNEFRLRADPLKVYAGGKAEPDGQWHHAAFVRHADGVCELYRDGKLLYRGRSPDSDKDVGGSVRVGHEASLAFNGWVDDACGYNRALQAADIAFLAGVGVSPALFPSDGFEDVDAAKPEGFALVPVKRIAPFTAGCGMQVGATAAERTPKLFVTVQGTSLRTYKVPSWEPLGSYRLPEPGYALAADGDSETVYVALNSTGTPEAPAGPVKVFSLKGAKRTGALDPGPEVLPTAGTVLGIIVSGWPSRVYVLEKVGGAGKLRAATVGSKDPPQSVTIAGVPAAFGMESNGTLFVAAATPAGSSPGVVESRYWGDLKLNGSAPLPFAPAGLAVAGASDLILWPAAAGSCWHAKLNPPKTALTARPLLDCPEKFAAGTAPWYGPKAVVVQQGGEAVLYDYAGWGRSGRRPPAAARLADTQACPVGGGVFVTADEAFAVFTAGGVAAVKRP